MRERPHHRIIKLLKIQVLKKIKNFSSTLARTYGGNQTTAIVLVNNQEHLHKNLYSSTFIGSLPSNIKLSPFKA